MHNGGARLDDLPLSTLYEIGYAELYRTTETMLSIPVYDDKQRQHPLEKAYDQIDQSIADATPDGDTGLPSWVLRNAPVAADGTVMAMPDLTPPDEEPMPPPGAKPGKPMPE